MRTETHRIETDDGLAISLRERSVTDPESAVVFVHGATYAGRAVFDPRGAPDRSWLAWAAEAGVAAFAVDVRGYGDSERPPEMDVDAEEGTPPAWASAAARDVDAAIRFVRERLSRPCPIHLVGTSWGTMIAGTLLTRSDPPDVSSVTLHAPVFEPDPDLLEGMDVNPPPTRTVTRAAARSRWDEQVPTEPAAAIRGGTAETDPAFDAFWETLASSGQGVDGEDAIVAPNGTLVDLAAASDGDPPYDPGAIDVPTLVVRGSLDTTSTRNDAIGLYDRLDVPDDRSAYVEIEGGTHFVHLERRRKALYAAVDAFHSRIVEEVR